VFVRGFAAPALAFSSKKFGRSRFVSGIGLRFSHADERRLLSWEMSRNLLIDQGPFSPQLGEKAQSDQRSAADFDSAIPRFESWRPSQISTAPSLP
jgi:hypothetical protein